jgi:hypothetical protein
MIRHNGRIRYKRGEGRIRYKIQPTIHIFGYEFFLCFKFHRKLSLFFVVRPRAILIEVNILEDNSNKETAFC